MLASVLISTEAILTLAMALPQAATERPDPEATPVGRREYLGREVARTMHWTGAGWLLRKTREEEENGARLRKWLAVKPGQAICDLGCGNGYHTLPLAQAVGARGHVYAVDLQPQMLTMLRQRAAKQDVENITYIEATVDDPKLPRASCDLVLMVDVYHELSHPVRVMRRVREALKPNGRVVLVEFRAEDPDVPIKPEHMMSKAQIVREMASHGFSWADGSDELPWQHAMAFVTADPAAPDFEAQQFVSALRRAVMTKDERITRPFLADGVKNIIDIEPEFLRPIPTLERDASGQLRARFTGADLLLQREPDGRWLITDWTRRNAR